MFFKVHFLYLKNNPNPVSHQYFKSDPDPVKKGTAPLRNPGIGRMPGFEPVKLYGRVVDTESNWIRIKIGEKGRTACKKLTIFIQNFRRVP